MLTPRQVAGLLGVSESTVRRWCDSGHLLMSKTTGGHRRIERHAVLEFARRNQFDLQGVAPLATAGRGGRLPDHAELSNRFYEHLVTGAESDVRQFLVGLVDRTGDAPGICDGVVAPALHRIGDEWAEARLPIYREHAATQRASSAISAARSHLALPRARAPVAICAALPGDPYLLGAAMCSLVLQSIGFDATLLGPETPVDEVLRAADELEAVLIAISVGAERPDKDDLAELCRRAERYGVRVAVGGRGLTPALRRQFSADFLGDTMAHLERFGRGLLGTMASSSGDTTGEQ